MSNLQNNTLSNSLLLCYAINMFDTTVFASKDFSVVKSDSFAQKVNIVDLFVAVIVTTKSQIILHEIVDGDGNKELILPIKALYNKENPKNGINDYLQSMSITSSDIRYLEAFSILPSLITTTIHLFGVYQADLHKELPPEYLITDLNGWETIVDAKKVTDALTIAAVEKVVKNIYQKKY